MFNIISRRFYFVLKNHTLIPSFVSSFIGLPLQCRKALVRLFDKIDRGSLKEGKRLSDMIIQLHKKRYVEQELNWYLFCLLTDCIHYLFVRQGSPRKRKGPISGTRGKERFRSEEAFYENPLPDCLCQRVSHDGNTSLADV